jgi:hypothetical protein
MVRAVARSIFGLAWGKSRVDKLPQPGVAGTARRSTVSLGPMDLTGVDLWVPLGFGFFAGLATVAVVGNWLKFVLALRQSVSPVYPPKAQFRIAGFPLLAFISPVPWISFVGLPFSAYFFIHVRHSKSAMVFFGTLGILVLVWLVSSIAVFWHFRKRHREKQSQ